MPVYRYARDWSNDPRTFTEAEWVAASWDYFERVPGEDDAAFLLWIVNEVWWAHRLAGTIIPADSPPTPQPEGERDHGPFRLMLDRKCLHPLSAIQRDRRQSFEFECLCCGGMTKEPMAGYWKLHPFTPKEKATE